jgi:hypothetical protein
MALRTVQVMIADIARRTGGQIPIGVIMDAIESANKEIHVKYDWPWTRAEANIQIQAPYQVGTLSINDQTNVFTGSGTSWSPAWQYKRLYLGQNNVDYLVNGFSDATDGTLVQTINTGTNFVNSTYTIFQDTYALPADCEFGSILLIVNPIYRYRLRYVPSYTLDFQSIFSRVFFTNFQSGFADNGYDDTGKTGLIRFAPAPGSICEYRIVYRRRPPSLQGLASTPTLPESFDRAIELLAEYKIRFGQKTPMAGWMEVKQEAYQMILDMRRRISTSMQDNYSAYSQYPYYDQMFGNSQSVFAGGLFIGPTAG